MKDYRKIYGQFDMIKNSSDHGLSKITYSSLEKYNKSPYLQKVIQHSQKKPVGLPPQNQNSEKEITTTSDKNNTSSKQQVPKSKQNPYYQLPKISTPIKFKEGQVTNYFRTQSELADNPLSKDNNYVGTHSATLDVNNTKNPKLEPIQRVNKIHYVTKTKAGTTGKQTKTNQDIAIVELKLSFGLKLFGVCDGHGVNGHFVSSYIKTNLIKNLNSSLKKCVNKPTIEEMKDLISKALFKTNDSLLQSEINTQLSGSTVICVFLYNNTIISFNIGDSRAILIKQIPNGSEIQDNKYDQSDKSSQSNKKKSSQFKFKHASHEWKAFPLSSDQKPDRQDEKQRIIDFGGRVFSQKSQSGEELGPLRVWMKDIMMPGLAMTRSFGDKAGMKAGTNGQPEALQFQMSGQQMLMVVASDGVWQYLQNDQVMTVLLPFYLKGDLQMAADRLVKIASEIWHKVSYSRDDITVVLVSLNFPNK